MLAEIKDDVDHISETWRHGTAEDQRAELAQLDDALAELDEINVDTPSATEPSRTYVAVSRS